MCAVFFPLEEKGSRWVEQVAESRCHCNQWMFSPAFVYMTPVEPRSLTKQEMAEERERLRRLREISLSYPIFVLSNEHNACKYKTVDAAHICKPISSVLIIFVPLFIFLLTSL